MSRDIPSFGEYAKPELDAARDRAWKEWASMVRAEAAKMVADGTLVTTVLLTMKEHGKEQFGGKKMLVVSRGWAEEHLSRIYTMEPCDETEQVEALWAMCAHGTPQEPNERAVGVPRQCGVGTRGGELVPLWSRVVYWSSDKTKETT